MGGGSAPCSASHPPPLPPLSDIKYATSWVWTKYFIGSTPPPSFGDDALSTNLFHQQQKQVANNILHRVCSCWILDMLEGLDLYLFWWDLMPELLHLLLYVFEEGCAWPTSNKHDWEDGNACQIHCHGRFWSDWFWSDFGSNDPKFCFSYCNYTIADQVHDHFWCDADDLFPCFARETGEFAFVPLYECIRVTIDIKIFTGHKLTLLVFPWVTVSAFLLFFCCSKMIAMQLAKFNLAKLWSRISLSLTNAILQRQSCFVCRCSAFGTFRYLHERIAQKCTAATRCPIAVLISVDFEVRMRWRMQTGKAFCCNSFGLSFEYDLSWRHKSCATLFSASCLGGSLLLSRKATATRLRVSLTVLWARGASVALENCPWQRATENAPIILTLCCLNIPSRNGLCPRPTGLQYSVYCFHTRVLFLSVPPPTAVWRAAKTAARSATK